MTTKIAIKTTLLLALSSILAGCSDFSFYCQHRDLPARGWDADSVLVFPLPEDRPDTAKMVITIRHTERYPFQNIWFFLSSDDHSDTLQVMLADDRGNWYGKHAGRIYEQKVYNLQVPLTSDTIRIRQAMREDCLRGIESVTLSLFTIDD